MNQEPEPKKVYLSLQDIADLEEICPPLQREENGLAEPIAGVIGWPALPVVRGCGASDGGAMLPKRPTRKPARPTRIPDELDKLRTEHSILIHDHARMLDTYAGLAEAIAARSRAFGIVGFGLGFLARWLVAV